MSADDAFSSTDAPELPYLDAGRVLALADDHRRGLHANRPVKACSRCLLATLGMPEAGTEAPAEDGS
jgi:hypothetical protein